MNTLKTLTISTLKIFVRNRQALFFSLFTPLIIMTVFGLVGIGNSKITIGVVGNTDSQFNRQLLGQMQSIPSLDIKAGNEQQERSELQEGNRTLVLFLPEQPAPLSSGQLRPQTVDVLVNGSDSQAPAAVALVRQFFNQATLAITGVPDLFVLRTQQVNSADLRYIDFLLPGIVALSVMQMAVFSVAFVFADYREKGILKRLLATPMKPSQFVIANVITRLLVAIVQAAILIAIGVLAFKAHVIGSYLLVFLIVVIGGIMFLGLGFTISGIARTVEAVPAIANLIVFPMLFLGGTFFPVSSMPGWLQSIVKFLPLTFFSDALRQVMTRNAGLASIRGDLLWMTAWVAILIFLANLTFSFGEKGA